VWTLFRFELRHILRDIQSLLVVAVIIPVLLAPFVENAFRRAEQQSQEAQKSTYFLAVRGGKAAEFRQLLPTLGRFRELPLQGPAEHALKEGLVDIYVTVDVPPAQTTEHGNLLTPQAFRSRLPETPLATIHFASSRERSWRARDALQNAITTHLKTVRNSRLKQQGHNPAQLYRLEDRNLASSEQQQLQMLGVMFPIVLVFVLFGTGSVTALDSIAGDRERGSLATVLVSSLSRWNIVMGKWLMVMVVSLSFAVLQLGGLYRFTRGFGGAGLYALSGPGWLLGIFLSLLMCAQVAALLLWISVRSSSFKQAQLLYMPALLVAAFLAAVSWMQELPLASILLAFPISGLSLALRDTLLQNGSALWVTLACIASLLWTTLTLHTVARSLQLDVGEPPRGDDPTDQFRQSLGQDIGWVYALIGAVMVVLPGNYPVLSGLRGQVLLNQGMMLLIPLLLLKVYRQPWRRALRWQGMSAWNWGAVIVAAPLVHLCANSVAIISSWLLPMPEDMVRQMTELLLPAGASVAELLLLIAVSPAICEEIAFRGVLLHAVQTPPDRVRPRMRTCAIVGLAFGAIHFSLQRLLPTTVIGFILTWVALRTGSIFPCMLLHFVNNALAVLLHPLHLDYTQLPGWTWLICWILLCYLLSRLRSKGFPQRSEEN
jgi:sodium transport system permease protein